METLGDVAGAVATGMAGYLLIVPMLFLANFLILFGPMLILGIQQIKAYEPGDADWGVRLGDVRGQIEAKQEITRVVSLWQSGEEFVKAGGKRERGVLFLGAPGTGKTMLSKAIATSFNCPFVTIPGSGFAQSFIGMDAVLVRWLAWKARRLAAKWGGQCIVFIDEIDAVGRRRSALGSGFTPEAAPSVHDHFFFGRNGALTREGDLVLETAEWREKLFAARAEPPRSLYPGDLHARERRGPQRDPDDGRRPGRRAGAQPAARGDGRHRRAAGDAQVLHAQVEHVPGRAVLRPAADVAAEAAAAGRRSRGRSRSTSSGRATSRSRCSTRRSRGRAGWAGTSTSARPTWEDRRDIFDLYLGKVAHDEELDTPRKRDELARITNGYSPAMIDQVCSLALTYAHADGREGFHRMDLVEAMTTVEAGVAIGQPYPKHEERATAIHEAGHAVCGHVFMENRLSTRLSIRKRGSSGGHHQAMEIEDRFGHWRSEEVGDLIWSLGAMAAEHVFYGQNTTGVTGDVGSATGRAAMMVGFRAMGPAPIDVADRIEDPEEREAAETRIRERFERIGFQIMNQSPGGLDTNPYRATLADGAKRPLVAGLLGQAFVVAYQTVIQNRESTERVADELIRAGELYGDDVMSLLDGVGLRKPDDRRPGRGGMAGDLIPPPSPAGRPPVDSMEDVRASVQLEEAVQPGPTAAGAPRAVAVPRALRVRVRRARRRGRCARRRWPSCWRPRQATPGRRWRRTGRPGSPTPRR